MVFCLCKALYEVKQAPHACHENINSILLMLHVLIFWSIILASNLYPLMGCASSKKYIEEPIQHFGFVDCRPISTQVEP